MPRNLYQKNFRDGQQQHTFSTNRSQSEEISVRLEERNIRKTRGSSAGDVRHVQLKLGTAMWQQDDVQRKRRREQI